MQGTEKLTEDNNDMELLLSGIDPDEAYCAVTNRIVIISPFPHHIHELVRELSAACYDVMVFHYADQELLLQLKPDLLIADLTRGEDLDLSWLACMEDSGILILHLVKPGHEAAGFSLEWPAEPADALLMVRSLMDAAKPQEQASSAKPEKAPAVAAGSRDDALRLKELKLDLRRYVVEIEEKRIGLTKTEFDLLRVILEAQGAVLTRQELMDRIWGDGYYGGSNTVDVHVKSLRQKLGDNPRKPRYVATVRGIGYRAADG